MRPVPFVCSHTMYCAVIVKIEFNVLEICIEYNRSASFIFLTSCYFLNIYEDWN